MKSSLLLLNYKYYKQIYRIYDHNQANITHFSFIKPHKRVIAECSGLRTELSEWRSMNPSSHHRPALPPPDWCLVLLEIQNWNTVLFRRLLLKPYQNCCIRCSPLTNFVSSLRSLSLFRFFRMSIQEQIIKDCCSRDIDYFCHSSYLHPLQTGSIAHVLLFFPFSSSTTCFIRTREAKTFSEIVYIAFKVT